MSRRLERGGRVGEGYFDCVLCQLIAHSIVQVRLVEGSSHGYEGVILYLGVSRLRQARFSDGLECVVEAPADRILQSYY